MFFCILYFWNTQQKRGEISARQFSTGINELIGMRSLELFWPFSILPKNLGDVLALSLSIILPSHFFIICAIIAKNTGLRDFEINYKADVPGGRTQQFSMNFQPFY